MDTADNEKVSLRLPRSILERARATVAHLQERTPTLSFDTFAARALNRECHVAEGRHNDSDPFPPAKLRAGRRPKK